MTDDTDSETDQANYSTAIDDTAVPQDAEWELATQVPYDDGENNGLVSTIIGAVAETEDVSLMEITEPPLYEVIDVAALETALFGSDTIGQSGDGQRTVEFMYRDHRIVVRSDAWVQIYEESEA